MKIFPYLLLSLVLISSGIHATIVEDIINKQVSAIIEKGVQKNIIPFGAYYVYAVSHFEELNKNNKTEYQVTAVIKNLNNRTKISLNGLFNEDLNPISYLYNYSFFNGAKTLSWNMGFHWLDFANDISSTYCPPQDFSENSFWNNMAPAMNNIQDISLGNINPSNSFQDLLNYALIVTQGNYPPPSDIWNAPTVVGLGATFFNNYYVITYAIESYAPEGDYYWNFVAEVLYQPCSQQKATIYLSRGSNIDDWHDI